MIRWRHWHEGCFARVQSPSAKRKAIMLQLSTMHAGPKSTAAPDNQCRTIFGFINVSVHVASPLTRDWNGLFPWPRRKCTAGMTRVCKRCLPNGRCRGAETLEENDGPASGQFPRGCSIETI